MRSIGILSQAWRKDKINELKEIAEKAGKMKFNEIWSGIDPNYIDGIKEIANIAEKYDMYFFVDINPEIMRGFGASPSNLKVFKELKIKGLRADYGFTIDDLIKMANNNLDLVIELNASIFPLDKLDYLISKVSNIERLKASHDFYPIKYTALSLENTIRKSKEFKERGIPVAAFIPSPRQVESRTTVEMLRGKEIWKSASILFNTGAIDRLILGEPFPTDEELAELVEAKEYMKIRVLVYPGITDEEKKIFEEVYYDVRIKEYSIALARFVKNEIKSRNITRRFRGAVTVMNNRPDIIEVWIFKREVEADKRFNVIGEILPEDMELLDYLSDMSPVKLVPIEMK
ncbi:MupG family TIM beta-alpha barrel fold protein [Sulfurisphaera ohwakuensis]|uniref:DUF871 family protein n=1 Tax=Sulfurisphaera ohwakuensis TaxID=69656 RepID=A0A650CFC6_SULOH|nr:MupG family TIM beta-alpha barrel fold protein [Sulfurisphaera ohwakuensis]MBB5255115.1 hypothetical protein [Sulfurisphaera ohwakuensis]QGR16563.1 DUF871 family protein [Sulfurisphaera ohwakuensis]